MSYNSYEQYSPYGQQQQAPPSYGNQPAYGQNPYSDANALEQGNGSYEMNSVQQPADTTTLLNRCREINDGIRDIQTKRQGQLVVAQNALLESNTAKEDQDARQALDYVENELQGGLRYLRDRIRGIKETPGSGDSRVQTQLQVTGRNLSAEIEQYQKVQTEFQKRLEEQVRRRYQIANPEATAAEIDQGVASVLSGQEQSFQVAGARTKRANDARQATQERSAAIRKIEKDLKELSDLIGEVAQLVHQQEPAVQQINQGAENVAGDLRNANTQLGHAVESARRARRWKWYALLVIILIIAIVVGVAVGVTAHK